MSNPWDQDWSRPAAPAGAAPWEVDWSGRSNPAPKPEQRGMLRGAADLGIELASGVARGVKFTADAFGADNAVSRGAGAVDEFAREYLSAQAKEDDQRIAQIMAAAEDAGVWEQVKAAAQAFAQAPVRMAANALGTSVPTIAATMIPGVGQAGAAARLGMLGGMGAVQGAGTVKGAIYEAVKAEQIKAGMSEEDATIAATRAQEYAGENTASIAGGAALGAAASSTGAQPVIARMLQGRGMLAQTAAEGAERGILARAGMGVVKEVPLESAQGGQEQLAANLALQNEGFDVPTWRGVAGQAALEGFAAGPMGGITGALDRAAPKATNPKADPMDPEAVSNVLGAQTLDDAIAAAANATSAGVTADGEILPPGTKPRRANESAIAEIRELDPEQQGEALGLLATAQSQRASPAVRRFAQNRLDELLLPVRQIPVGEVIEDEAIPAGEAQELTFTEATSQILEPPTFDQRRTTGKRVPVGQATELSVEDVEPFGNIPTGEVTELGGPRPEGMPERRNTDALPLDLSGRTAVAGYIERMRGINTPAARAFVQDYNAGRITPDDVMGLLGAKPAKPEPTADQRLAAAAAQKQPILPTDLLTADRMPYGSRTAAGIRARKEDGAVIPVEGGWVVRKETTNEQPDLARTAPGPAGAGDGASPVPGGSLGTVRPDPDAPGPDVRGATPPEPSSGTPDAVGSGDGANPTLRDIPALKRAWSDAVARGDTAGAARINEQIVAAKKAPVVVANDYGEVAAPAPAVRSEDVTYAVYAVMERPAVDGIEPLSFEDADFELEAMQDRAARGKLRADSLAQSEFGKRIDTNAMMALNAGLKSDPAWTLQALRDAIAAKKARTSATPPAANMAPGATLQPPASLPDKIKAKKAAEPAKFDDETYRVTPDDSGRFTLNSDESIIAGNGDGSPRRFASEAAARDWAKKNGVTLEGPTPATPDAAAPPTQPSAQAEGRQAAAPPRNEAVIELRKRISVLESLRKCLG